MKTFIIATVLGSIGLAAAGHPAAGAVAPGAALRILTGALLLGLVGIGNALIDVGGFTS